MARLVKAERRRFARLIELQTAALGRALDKLFERIARREVARLRRTGALAAGLQTRVAKAGMFTEDDELEMLNILRVFGLRRVRAAGSKAAAAAGDPGAWAYRPEVVETFFASKFETVTRFGDRVGRELDLKLRDTLLEAERDGGVSVGELGRRVFRAFRADDGVLSASGAMRVARTETVGAENFGRIEGFQAAGVRRLRWVTVIDDRERSTHRELDGVEVEVGEPFVDSDGNVLRFPGDPLGPAGAVINCRCTVIPVFEAVEAAEDAELLGA